MPRESSTARLSPPLWQSRRPVPVAIGIVTAAALLATALILWQRLDRPRLQPVFVPRSLVSLYQENVEQGFEPYYECDDPQRFAATFRERQRLALRLAPLPQGRRMLGLSYPGGLSRDTTAMLATSAGQPVMVFVDRAKFDRSDAVRHNVSGIHVFRQERDGLVLYEVTPAPAPEFLDYLVVDDNPSH